MNASFICFASMNPIRKIHAGAVMWALMIVGAACSGPLRAEDVQGVPPPSLAHSAEALLTQARKAGNRKDRLRFYDTALREYGGSADPDIRKQVALAVEGIAGILERDRDGAAKIAERIQLLEGGPNAECIPRLLNAQAKAPGSRSTKRSIYGRVIAEYGDSRNPYVRREALRALMEKARLSNDAASRIALLDRMLSLAEGVDAETFARYVIHAALYRADLLDDKDEMLRGYNIVLEQGLRRAAEFGGILQRQLEETLDAKTELMHDAGLKNRYYEAILTLNASPLSAANALTAKTRNETNIPERVALYDRIIAEYGDNPDERLRQVIASATFQKALHRADIVEKHRLLDVVAAGYGDSSDPEVRELAIQALLVKANFTTDKAEIIRLSERAMGMLKGGESPGFSPERRYGAVARRKARLSGDRADPEWRYDYDSLIAKGGGDEDILALLLAKAQWPELKIAAYDEIIARFKDSDNPYILFNVNSARRDKAFRIEDKDGKIALYDEIISERLDGAFEWQICDAYREKIDLLTDPAEKIKLYDEILAYSESDPEVLAPLDGPPAQNAIEEQRPRRWKPRLGMQPWDQRVDVARSVSIKALQNKAELAAGTAEKIALYDRLLERYGGAPEAHLGRILLDAAKAKAELLKDDSVVDAFVDRRIRLYPNSAETFESLFKKTNAIADDDARVDAQDRLIERFSNIQNKSVSFSVIGALYDRADAIEPLQEKLSLYDRIIAIGLPLDSSVLKSPVFPALEKRLELTTDPKERIAVYDRVIAGLEKIGRRRHDDLFANFLLAKAELVADNGEKIRLCDAAISEIEQYAGLNDYHPIITKALGIKARASGDNTLESQYYDSVINESWEVGDLLWAIKEGRKAAVDVEEEIRVLNQAIAKLRNFPFEQDEICRLLVDKAKLVNDPNEKTRICDEALLFCDTDADELDIIRKKAAAVGTKAEKIALYRQAYDKFGGKGKIRGSDRIMSLRDRGHSPIIELILDWADILEDDSERIELYTRMLDACEKDTDFATRRDLRNVTRKMAALTGGRARLLEYYDRRIALAKSDKDAAYEHLEKAALAGSPEAANAILDEMLALYRHSEDRQAQFAVADALKRKITLTTDVPTLAGIYNELAVHSKKSDHWYSTPKYYRIRLKQAGVTLDRDAAMALCDEVMDESEDAQFWLEYVEAAKKLVELTDDAAEKTLLCDAVLENAKGRDTTATRQPRYIYLPFPTYDMPWFSLQKAAAATDRAEKIRLYDRILDSLEPWNNGTALAALYAKIDLADNPAEKLALCNRLIGFVVNASDKSDDFQQREIPRALGKKAELTGDLSPVIAYYDSEIAVSAGPKAERLELLKFRDTGDREELLAACDRVIAAYSRGRGLPAERTLLALAYTAKAEAQANAAAATEILDGMIAAFAPDGAMPNALEVVNAMNKKVALTASPEEKAALYDEIIVFCRRHLSARNRKMTIPPPPEVQTHFGVQNALEEAVRGKVEVLREQQGRLELE